MSLTIQTAVAKSGAEPGERTALLVLQPCPQPGKSALGTRLARSSRWRHRAKVDSSWNRAATPKGEPVFQRDFYKANVVWKYGINRKALLAITVTSKLEEGSGKWKSDNIDRKKYHCMWHTSHKLELSTPLKCQPHPYSGRKFPCGFNSS